MEKGRFKFPCEKGISDINIPEKPECCEMQKKWKFHVYNESQKGLQMSVCALFLGGL